MYISTTSLVKMLRLHIQPGGKRSIERGKKRFYAVCESVGWKKIHITAAQARRRGIDTSGAPRDWYYPKEEALALWKKFLGDKV